MLFVAAAFPWMVQKSRWCLVSMMMRLLKKLEEQSVEYLCLFYFSVWYFRENFALCCRLWSMIPGPGLLAIIVKGQIIYMKKSSCTFGNPIPFSVSVDAQEILLLAASIPGAGVGACRCLH
jgi:hypothetical protein